MTHLFRRMIPGAGMLLLVPLLAAPVLAQERPGEVAILRQLSPSEQLLATGERSARNAEADALVLEAGEAEDRGKAMGAARRYERAAALRAPEDVRRIEHLTSAANAYRNARRWNQAATTSMAVAEGNLYRGDVFEAARWFTNASYLFASAGKEVRAQQAIWKACTLSLSPHLDEEQRTRIQQPISNCSSELERLSATPRS